MCLDQPPVANRQPGPNEQRACSAAPRGYRSVFLAGEIFGLETIGTIGTAGNHWNRLFLGVFKAMERLDPQVKRKIFSDNPRRFHGIEAF
jgi:hypothetical protein